MFQMFRIQAVSLQSYETHCRSSICRKYRGDCCSQAGFQYFLESFLLSDSLQMSQQAIGPLFYSIIRLSFNHGEVWEKQSGVFLVLQLGPFRSSLVSRVFELQYCVVWDFTELTQRQKTVETTSTLNAPRYEYSEHTVLLVTCHSLLPVFSSFRTIFWFFTNKLPQTIKSYHREYSTRQKSIPS